MNSGGAGPYDDLLVKDALELRQQAERAISGILSTLQARTGLRVTGVTFERFREKLLDPQDTLAARIQIEL